MVMVEFTLEGLNTRQRVLADIMWQLEEYEQVEAFIATLPDREACECQTIIEMMRMAVVEQCHSGIEQEYTEADQLINRVKK
jgi:hypothetical protein